MDETTDKFVGMAVTSQEKAGELMDRLLEVAEPRAVFSQPVESNGYTVITASEVSANAGYGFGLAFGEGSPEGEGDEKKAASASKGAGGGAGGGGAGGGASFGRPVAVVSIGPDGVRVTPVVDATKIALAWITVLGTLFLMLRRMRRPRPFKR